MKLNVKYFENSIVFNNTEINVLEIENKAMFYLFIRDLHSINSYGVYEDIQFFGEDAEINMINKLKIYVDFFDFQFDSKKSINDISKYASSSVNEEDKDKIKSLYNKIIKSYEKILNEIDLPLCVDNEFNFDNLSKLIKIAIETKDELLDNLLLLIDLERVLKSKCLLVFVNLKQYLSKNELIELYKYAIYNNVNIFLVDSQSYGVTLKYEKKLIIDDNLDEFVL